MLLLLNYLNISIIDSDIWEDFYLPSRTPLYMMPTYAKIHNIPIQILSRDIRL